MAICYSTALFASLCCRNDRLGRLAAQRELDVRLGVHAYTPNLMYVTLFGSVAKYDKIISGGVGTRCP